MCFYYYCEILWVFPHKSLNYQRIITKWSVICFFVHQGGSSPRLPPTRPHRHASPPPSASQWPADYVGHSQKEWVHRIKKKKKITEDFVESAQEICSLHGLTILFLLSLQFFSMQGNRLTTRPSGSVHETENTSFLTPAGPVLSTPGAARSPLLSEDTKCACECYCLVILNLIGGLS